jgi:hypothetical protein
LPDNSMDMFAVAEIPSSGFDSDWQMIIQNRTPVILPGGSH